jgi:hypothetical protein
MTSTKGAIYKWNTLIDATKNFRNYEMDLDNLQTKGDYSYLLNPVIHNDRNPPLMAAFVPSFAMPAGGYNALPIASKSLYMTESNAWNSMDKLVREKRAKHTAHCNLAFSDLNSLFSSDCFVRRRIFEMRKAAHALIPLPEDSDVYLQILVYIQTYAPNKPVDIETWLKTAQALSCRDGRGWAVNCGEFVEALEHLQDLGALPDRMTIQRWISEIFLKDAPSAMRSHLSAYGRDNATDATAGAVQPAVPRWKTLLETLSIDI